MLELIIGFTIGAVFGGAFGVCMFALVSVGKEDEENE